MRTSVHSPTSTSTASPPAATSSTPSLQDTSEGADPEELAAEVAQLEQKAVSLGRVVEEQHDGVKKLNAEVARSREQAGTAEALREAARKEKECVQMLLNAKTEELSRKTVDCGRLQEKSLALVKELAALNALNFCHVDEVYSF